MGEEAGKRRITKDEVYEYLSYISDEEIEEIEKIYNICLLRCTPAKMISHDKWMECMIECMDDEFIEHGW